MYNNNIIGRHVLCGSLYSRQYIMRSDTPALITFIDHVYLHPSTSLEILRFLELLTFIFKDQWF